MVIDLTRRLAANPAEPVARPPELCSRWRRDSAAHYVAQRTATCPALRITPSDLRGTSVSAAGDTAHAGVGGAGDTAHADGHPRQAARYLPKALLRLGSVRD